MKQLGLADWLSFLGSFLKAAKRRSGQRNKLGGRIFGQIRQIFYDCLPTHSSSKLLVAKTHEVDL